MHMIFDPYWLNGRKMPDQAQEQVIGTFSFRPTLKRGSMGKSSSPVQWLHTTVQELPFEFSISVSSIFISISIFFSF